MFTSRATYLTSSAILYTSKLSYSWARRAGLRKCKDLNSRSFCSSGSQLFTISRSLHMDKASFSVKGLEITVPTELYIGGSWIKGNGERLQTINPATEDILATVDTADVKNVDRAVVSARKAFETTWGMNISASERSTLIFKLADIIETHVDELAYLESLDAGKIVSWCKADIADAVACFRYYAGAADKIQGSTIEIDDREKCVTVRREPIGVVAAIVPWNYSILMSAWKLAPSLAAGCSVILKPAENTPLSMLKFVELFDRVGFPPGVLNLLNGLGSVTGQLLAEHMDVDKIAFTGSTATGRRIAQSASKSNLKAVTLELGGKSANIIFEDANLEEAAKWAAFGVFENMGQSCTAGSRVLVQESIYEEFLPLLVRATQSIKVGDPLDETNFQGPQISKSQFDRIMYYIEQGKSTGAKIATGGKRVGNKGFFIEPTVFTNVKPSDKIAQEEIFGPVVAVIKFKDEEEAIEIANSTSYGLAAGVHSLNSFRLHRVTRRLKAGTVWQNQYLFLHPSVPFGGYKQSGWGRELGLAGLDTYLISKSVHQYYGGDLTWPVTL